MGAIEDIGIYREGETLMYSSSAILISCSERHYPGLFEYLKECSHILFYANLRRMCEAYGFSVLYGPIAFTLIPEEIRKGIVDKKYALVSLGEFTGLPGLENSYIVLEESGELLAVQS